MKVRIVTRLISGQLFNSIDLNNSESANTEFLLLSNEKNQRIMKIENANIRVKPVIQSNLAHIFEFVFCHLSPSDLNRKTISFNLYDKPYCFQNILVLKKCVLRDTIHIAESFDNIALIFCQTAEKVIFDQFPKGFKGKFLYDCDTTYQISNLKFKCLPDNYNESVENGVIYSEEKFYLKMKSLKILRPFKFEFQNFLIEMQNVQLDIWKGDNLKDKRVVEFDFQFLNRIILRSSMAL